MTPNELINKQEELNLKKYNQSILAHCDMSGKTDFCKGCLFKTDLPCCAMDHETRQKYTVCARNFFRLEEEKNAIREQSKQPRQGRIGKSKEKRTGV